MASRWELVVESWAGVARGFERVERGSGRGVGLEVAMMGGGGGGWVVDCGALGCIICAWLLR